MAGIFDKNQLEEIKKSFEDKLNSLTNDCERAFTSKVEIGAAPFPITLYCMSMVDFFSGAYLGYSKKDDSNKLNQGDRMAQFLNDYLGYDIKVSRIALDIFRHKLVHLGQPHISVNNTNQVMGWQISSQEDPRDHWQVKEFDAKGNKKVNFGVINFINDLKIGVLGENGYFENLTKDPRLQKNYLNFFEVIK